jgi:hypothetical protein
LAVAIIRGKNLKRGKTRREKGKRKRKRRKDKGTIEVKKVKYINAKGEKPGKKCNNKSCVIYPYTELCSFLDSG